jgi:hypothetical protein
MPSWHPTATHFSRLTDLLRAPDRRRALLDADLTVPPEVIDYLARLYLLYGVPFNYLVPDPRMLPEESIRFFFLDPNWLNALIDGAMSIGRVTTQDAAQDDAVKQLVLEKAAEHVATLRPTFGRAARPLTDANTTWSGFLLRSAVVSGWPGLEIEAYQDAEGTTPLSILRMDRLGRTVLICIFNGVYQRLDIHEPSEGIQFGADYNPKAEPDPSQGPVYSKSILRGLGANGQQSPPAGAPVNVSPIPVPTRDDTNRVVPLAQFAAALPPLLSAAGIQTPAVLTAAEFGVEMVESPTRQIFHNSGAGSFARAPTARRAAADELAAERERLTTYLFGGPN